MKRIALALAALFIATSAFAQNPVKLCISTNSAGSNCVPITSTYGLPVTPISGGTPQDVNISQTGGVTVAKGAGTAATALRVELPTDGTGKVGLNAGSAIVGKVGIDQTTPGTTNLVAAGQSGSWSVAVPAAATGGASFLNIAAGQATTTVKSGAGTLYSLCFNSAATATNITTVYDNTAASGTIIAIPAATTATVPTCLQFGSVGLAFATGLTIITGTANGSNMTVSYK